MPKNAKSATRYEVAKALAGGEIPQWQFQNQVRNLLMVIDDMHQCRPLMPLGDILRVIVTLGK